MVGGVAECTPNCFQMVYKYLSARFDCSEMHFGVIKKAKASKI